MIKELLLGSGALGLAYLLKRQYDKKLERVRKKAFEEGRDSEKSYDKHWRQKESEEDRQIIYQGDCAKGTHLWDKESFVRDKESFDWDSEGLDNEGNPPEWHGYVVRALSDSCFFACLARAYARRYGYIWGEGCGFRNINWYVVRGEGCYFGEPREVEWAGNFITRMDRRYKLARDGYLISCKGIVAFMDTKKAMDSWYLAQRARFLGTYQVKSSAYNFYTHPLAHTLLELDLQRERAALLHDKGSNKQRFFTNAMALYELHHKEWRTYHAMYREQYALIDMPPSPLREMDCWYQICRDIWEGKGFMHYVKEEEERAKERGESKMSESEFYEIGLDYQEIDFSPDESDPIDKWYSQYRISLGLPQIRKRRKYEIR